MGLLACRNRSVVALAPHAHRTMSSVGEFCLLRHSLGARQRGLSGLQAPSAGSERGAHDSPGPRSPPFIELVREDTDENKTPLRSLGRTLLHRMHHPGWPPSRPGGPGLCAIAGLGAGLRCSRRLRRSPRPPPRVEGPRSLVTARPAVNPKGRFLPVGSTSRTLPREGRSPRDYDAPPPSLARRSGSAQVTGTAGSCDTVRCHQGQNTSESPFEALKWAPPAAGSRNQKAK